MKRNTLLVLAMFLSETTFSQDFSFNILPLAINPAFTGLFDGRIRATALYKSNRIASKNSFIAYGGSADTRFTSKRPQYFATGLAFLQGQTTDGSFTNSSGIGSIAYHKIINSSNKNHGGEIAAGLQVGYIQRNLLLSRFDNSVAPYVFHIGAGANYLIANAGLSYAQSLGPNVNFAVGLSGNNLTLFNDGTTNEQPPLLQVTASYIGLAIVDWKINDRLGFRPATLYIINRNFYMLGNEFRYKTSKTGRLQTAFLDLWYRSTKIVTFTPGYEFSYFRLGIGFDYRLSPNIAAGNSGFQIVARYVMPKRKQAPTIDTDDPSSQNQTLPEPK